MYFLPNNSPRVFHGGAKSTQLREHELADRRTEHLENYSVVGGVLSHYPNSHSLAHFRLYSVLQARHPLVEHNPTPDAESPVEFRLCLQSGVCMGLGWGRRFREESKHFNRHAEYAESP